MTREDFTELIEGMENEPFIITIHGKQTPILKYDRLLTDSVKVFSRGKPAIYKLADIVEITFDIENDENDADAKSNTNTEPKSPESFPYDPDSIILHKFSLYDRSEAIHSNVLGTPLAQSEGRTRNILKEAKKNHDLYEKSKKVTRILIDLKAAYPCIELYQMIGESYACRGEWIETIQNYELANDYQNAAYYAQKLETKSNSYLMDILAKWIILGENCGENVYSSFFFLSHKMKRGRFCYEIIKTVKLDKLEKEILRLICDGLRFVLSGYSHFEHMDQRSSEFINNISKMLETLGAQTRSESYKPINVINLPHASDIGTKEHCIGYILEVPYKPTSTSGFVSKDKDFSQNIFFESKNIIDESINSVYSDHHGELGGLRVSYTLEKHGAAYVAVNIRSAESVKAFLDHKDLEKMVIKNPDGTYSGYISNMNGNYGFINKDPSNTLGIYFYGGNMSKNLFEVKDRIKGLKVRFDTIDVERNGKMQKNAINVIADEDLESFLANNKKKKIYVLEDVNEEEIDKKLRNNSPAAVVQEYATSGKPSHALVALEKTKDSFPYDKYVNHKIQLLQRTKTNDSELIDLLNYAVNASQDNSYIAHHLFFLGQVQYRCKKYSDVIQTMKTFGRYKEFIKNKTLYPESIYYMAVSYYMLKDYANSDEYSHLLEEYNIHLDDVERLLNRTFDLDADEPEVNDNDEEFLLPFDSGARLTPFIEKLIDEFSFGNISVNGIPVDFDPDSSDLTETEANRYIRVLKVENGRPNQRNNPNISIAMAKIEKWCSGKFGSIEHERAETDLRKYISVALQIMALVASQQSGTDIRVHLFYRMQQYEMSIPGKRDELFYTYVNSHYGNFIRNRLMISTPPTANNVPGNYNLTVSDILIFFAAAKQIETERTHLDKLCKKLKEREDKTEYLNSLLNITLSVSPQLRVTENDIVGMFEQAIPAVKNWLDSFRRDVRNSSLSGNWNELCSVLEQRREVLLLTGYEKIFIKTVLTMVSYIQSADSDTKTVGKLNYLNQSVNLIEDTIADLKEKPTYIIYSVFSETLLILKDKVLTMIREVMSHEPDIVPVNGLQINLGLTDIGEFILPLEFQNKPPAVAANNFKISIDKISPGVELLSELPNGQNINENERYSQSLIFRASDNKANQIDISVKAEYTFDTSESRINNSERATKSKVFDYTVSFQDVPRIVNRYAEFSQRQTVTDDEMFFGRDPLIERLFDAITIKNGEDECTLRGGNGIVLYGQRRSGKTSILYHLKKKVKKETDYTIIVDLGSSGKRMSKKGYSDSDKEAELQKLNSEITLELFYKGIINEINNYLIFNSSKKSEIKELSNIIKDFEKDTSKSIFPSNDDYMNCHNWQALFNEFIETFTGIINNNESVSKFGILILIDEFTYFNAAIQEKHLPSNFMEIIKAILADSIITLVIAGQDNTIEFIEHYVNEFMSFHREWVTFLGENDSYKMVTEPMGEGRVDPDAAKKLYIFTAGSPYLLMDVCAKLVKWMNDHKILKLSGGLPDDFLTTAYMTEQVFDENLIEPQYCDAGRLDLTAKIKLVLGLIARSTSHRVSLDSIPWSEYGEYAEIGDEMLEGRGISKELMKEILMRLVKREVIEKQDGYQNRYRIKIPLCREWILRRGGDEYGNE